MPNRREQPLTARDREASAGLAAALHAVYGVLSDPVLTAGLLERGYDMEEFQTGLTLQAAAEDVFVTCQSSLSALDRATVALEESWVQAREDYLEFRSVVRRNSAEVPAAELGVSGTVMPGFAAFVAQARASYASAQAPRHAESLARNGFDAQRLKMLVGELLSLVELQAAVNRLRAGVDRQLDDRDLALAMLNLWIRELLQQTRMVSGVTYHPPDLISCRQRMESVRTGTASPACERERVSAVPPRRRRGGGR